ncbi:MAG: DDE-type integrase/transposase/recombinase [Arenicellales bacterium]|jgi:putative transposase|nr:DDE-type integrase/transposase/recombinase [Arenicellales bacterium]
MLPDMLRLDGEKTGRKQVSTRMKKMGIEAFCRPPNTSQRHPGHQIYPSLLRGLDLNRPNQVWATDITYLPMAKGLAYLTVILDWYSRKALCWRVSNHG